MKQMKGSFIAESKSLGGGSIWSAQENIFLQGCVTRLLEHTVPVLCEGEAPRNFAQSQCVPRIATASFHVQYRQELLN